jgi:hypothetical protein
MRRALLIAAVLAFAFQTRASEKNRFLPELIVQGEYRRDILDYDDVEKQFARERISLAFSKKSSVNIAHVYIGSSGENRFTGNITVSDISDHYRGIVGSYYINFGAGLLVGKKSMVRPDLFSRKLIVSRTSSYSPCNSGNPLFCFQGIAAALAYAFTDVSVSLSSFLSIKNRYTGNEAYLSDRTELSFNSIITRVKKDYRHSEPVDVNDYGGAAEIRIGDHFLLQNYFIYSDMKRNRAAMLWNLNERGILDRADTAFYGYGSYARYRDEYVTIFCEFGVPNRVLRHESGKRETLMGYGTVYGIIFRHPVCRLSLTGKNTDKSFYTPYSSGNGFAEHALMAEISIDPLKQLTIGAGFWAENKVSPGFNESYLSREKRERAFLRYRLRPSGRILLKFNYLTNEKRFGTERRLQLYSSIKYYVHDSILISLSGKTQKKEGGSYSGSIHSGIGFTILNCVSVIIYFSRYFITGNNYVYSALSSNPDAISPGSFIKTSSNAALVKISARYKDAVLSAGYELRFSGLSSIQNRIEFFGKCVL